MGDGVYRLRDLLGSGDRVGGGAMNIENLKKLIEQAQGKSANEFWLATGKRPTDVIVDLAKALEEKGQLSFQRLSENLTVRDELGFDADANDVTLMGLRNAIRALRQRAEAAEQKYRDEFAMRVIDEVVDADPRQIMGKGRIREISEGADVLVGEKVLLAKTALYYIEKNREAIEGFQRVGLLLVEQQEHNAELEQRLQQSILLPRVAAIYANLSDVGRHRTSPENVRDVVDAIQAHADSKVKGAAE